MTGSEKRRLKRIHRDARFLNELLDNFWVFLSKNPQPSDQEVRSKFIDLDMTWKSYCMRNHLNLGAELLFNAKVTSEWRKLEEMR